MDIVFVELGSDHRTGLVPGDQGADIAALSGGISDAPDDGGIQPLWGHRSRHQRIGTKALLRDFVDKGVRCPERTHTAARNTGQKRDCLGHLSQPPQACFAPDGPVARLDHDGETVRAKQIGAVLLECLDVLMANRQLLLEPSVHAQLHGEPGHTQGKQREYCQHPAAVPEQPGLGARQRAARLCFLDLNRHVHSRPHRVRETTTPT
ncbi:hypothetical protein D3C76_1138340 [compost metagenome]